MSGRTRLRRKFSIIAAGLASALTLVAQEQPAAAPLPENPTVVHGKVEISTNGADMTVKQDTQFGIVNWNSFSVGAGQGVHFANGNGATLNRVTGLTASRIDGTLTATGSVYLLNKNGVIIGENGRVLTGGDFLASTRDISDEEFLRGGGFALVGDSTAGVTNLGQISSLGGNVLLAGYTVENKGSIDAASGRIGLVAGQHIDVLTDVSWMNGAYAVSLGERGNNVTTSGRLQSLVAELRTHNGNIYALAGNNTGLIQATGVKNEGGKIILTADGGTVQSTGTITATRDGDGGDIAISAATIENYGGTQDVSGATGGTIKLTAGSVTTDTTMLARGTSGAGGTLSIETDQELLFTSSGVADVSGATQGGELALDAGAGHLVLSGRLAANGGESGGQISLWGQRLGLLGATVRAEGGAQGGRIYVGGGYQGGNVWSDARLSPLREVANAQRTYIGSTTTLSADATGSVGQGGMVVAWADGSTEFAGKITARGGKESGDGGTVETSGLAGLGVSGTVDAGARGIGANGQWLLDPKNITIGNVTDSISEFQSIIQGFGASLSDLTSNVRFGTTLDLSGETLVVGSNAGAAFVFESGSIQARLAVSGYSTFGSNVQVEGGVVAVLSSGTSGAVHLFTKGTGWKNGQNNLTATMANPGTDFFGSNLALTKNSGGSLYLAATDTGYTVSGFANAGTIWSAPITAQGTSSGFSSYSGPTAYAGRNLGGLWSVSAGTAYVTDNTYRRLYSINLATGATQSLGDFLSGQQGQPFVVDNNLIFAYSQSAGGLAVGSIFNGVAPTGTISFNTSNNVYNTLAISGDTMVLGTGANGLEGSVTIFQAPAGGWGAVSQANPAVQVFRQVAAASSPQGNEQRTGLGASIAIDGNYIAVGMPGLDLTTSGQGRMADRGGVLTIRRTNGTWTADANTLAPTQVAEITTFGQEIDADGNTLVIADDRFADPLLPGETGRGRVYVYESGALSAMLSGLAGGSGVFTGFGDKVAVSGNRIVATSAFSFDGNTTALLGRAELFTKGTGWRNGTANRVGHYDFHGMISAVALDGTTLAIGTPVPTFGAPGSVFLFSDVTSGFGSPITLQNPFRVSNVADNFGNSLALSGNTLAIGQPRSPSSGNYGVNRGSVNEDYSSTGLTDYNIFLFENLGNNWSTATVTRLLGANILNPAQDSVGWGYSLALDGDTLVTGYRRDAPAGSTRGVYVFQRNGTWANSTTPVARLTGSARNFGFDVDIENNTIVVSSPNFLENWVYGSPTGTDSPLFVFQRQGGWRSGTTNLVSTLLPATGVLNRSFGNNVVLNDQSVFASTLATRVGAASTIFPVLQFNGPFTLDARGAFTWSPGADLAISATSLANSLSLGTNITLQANNDITVSSAITVNNTAGDGGDLTLQAGRRILINAPITTDNGDLTLLAGDTRANATYRDAGEKVVMLGRDSGNNPATLTLGSGNLIINAADRFENRTGSTSPFVFSGATPGRYLVYSTTPDQTNALDRANLLADLATTGRSWVYYNKTVDLANLTPSYLPAGSGFVYSVQPTVQVGVGNASITYGQTATANLTLTGLTLGGNTISGSVFGIGSSDLANLVTTGYGSNVTLSAGGFANAGTYTGGMTAAAKTNVTTGAVYGVAVSTGAAGNLTVAKATLTYRPDNATRVYGDANPTFTATYTGFVTGDTASVIDTQPTFSTTAASGTSVGTYAITGTGGLDNNYLFSASGTGQLTITVRDLLLTGLTGVDRAYNGGTSASFTGTPTIAPVNGDSLSLAGLLTATASFADRHVGTAKPLTLSGLSLSGAAAGNYNLVLPTNLRASITPAPLTVAGVTAQNRTYDGTTAATAVGTATITPFGTDAVTLAGTASASFTDKTAGTNKTVTLTGLTLTGTDANNYTLVAPTLTATVAPLGLNVTGLTANNRVYNATTTATLTGTAAVTPLGTDSVSVTGTATASFADRHVGNLKPVTVAGLSLSGTDARNYSLILPSLFANITPASLGITGLTGVNRLYDGTTDASVTGNATVAPLGSDVVTVTGTPTATFANKSAGTGIALTIAGLTLTGADAQNYLPVQPTGLTANILPRPITVTDLVALNKVYDGTTTLATTGTPTFGGILSGDFATFVLNSPEFSFATRTAGTAKAIVVSGVSLAGADAANYDTTSVSNLTANITPATLTVAGASAASRTYDATNVATVSGGALTGVIGTDAVTLSTASAAGTFADKTVGTAKAVTATGYSISGADAANYTLAQPTGLTADITPFTLAMVGLTGNKTYDGTNTAPLSITGLDAVFTNDAVTVDFSGVTATYANKAAGTAKPITLAGLFTLTGADAANYLLTQPTSLTGNIARRGITVTGLTIADKTYDGTTAGTISGTGTFGGTIAGDDLAINVGAITVTFADKNAGVNKAIALSGVSLSGADADNYTAATPSGITATIFAKDLSVTGLAAQDKVYDRTTTATLTGTGALQGTIAGDAVALNETARAGNFADKNAGTAKSVAVTGLTLTGNASGNYRLVAPTLTASITPATATVVGLAAANRTYNATTVAPLTGNATLDFGALNNVLASAENISLSGTAAGSFATKNVGTAKAVTVGGLSLSGNDARNYNLVLPTSLTANVTTATLNVTGTTIAGRVYDATTAATFSNFGTVTALGTDAVTLVTTAATAAFTDKNVGTNKTVTASGFTLTGADAANYTLTQPTGLTANVTRADLLLTGVIANNRLYDGTRSAPLSGNLTIAPLGTDRVTVSGTPAATFADKNVGTAKAVTLSGLTLAGDDSANYNFVLPSLSASVTPRPVTVSGLSAANRVYDGTTAATLTGTASLANVVAGDNLGFNLAAVTARFADKNVGVSKLVSLVGNALTGSDAANYQQVLPSTLTATITAKLLTILGVDAVDRAYDRTTSVALTGGTLGGTLAGDAVSLVTTAATGSIADRNIGVNKTVTASGYTLSGGDAANYTVAQPTGVDVTITAKQVDVTGLQVADKFFDGTTTATVSGGTLGGIISGDGVSLVTSTGAANFADATVGLNKTVTLTGFSLSGSDASNYKLPAPLTTLGNILQSLRVITEIIPAEVLKATTNAELDRQRATLEAFNSARPPSIVINDYSATLAKIATGVPVVPSLPANFLIAAETSVAAKAFAGHTAWAQGIADKAQAAANAYRDSLARFTQLGEQANAADRALSTETALLGTLRTQISRTDAELAKARENLATIAEARRRIDTLTRQIEDAARLGRGSEVAAYEKAIAEARGILATEAQARANFDALQSEADRSRANLAASEAKVAQLAADKARLSADAKQVESGLAKLEEAATKAKQDAKNALSTLARYREEAVVNARIELGQAQRDLEVVKTTTAPVPVAAQVDKLMSEPLGSLLRDYPLSPGRVAVVENFEKNLNDAKAVKAGLEARVADAERAKRETPQRSVEVAEDLSSQLRGLTSDQVAALDFKALKLTEEQALPSWQPEIKKLSATASELDKKLSSLGTLLDGTGQIIPATAPANLVRGSERGVKSIDQPTVFAPAVEEALKNELRSAGALMDFSSSPQLAALPVAAQLQLQNALRDYVARKNADPAFDANKQAVQGIHDAAGDLASMALFEALDSYGVGEIPGVQEAVAKGISTFTQNISQVADARNPEEALAQVGKTLYESGKAVVNSIGQTYTGGAVADAEKAKQEAANAKAIEDRRRSLFETASSIMKLEADRVAATQARDKMLDEAKSFVVASRLPDELFRPINQADAAIESATKQFNDMKVATIREQVAEQVAAKAVTEERNYAVRIAEARGRAEAAAAAIAMLDAQKPQPSVPPTN